MKAVINDRSFEYEFAAKELAVNAVHEWLDICLELQKEKVRRVQDLYGNSLDVTKQIAPDYKIIQMVQDFQDREQRRRLLSILVNSRIYDTGGKYLVVDGKPSYAAVWAGEDGLLISLRSNEIFEDIKIQCMDGEKGIDIDNLSRQEHIGIHSEKLGIRYYEENPKHGKRDYIRSGGTQASAMDLTDEQAQNVLDQAVEVRGHLYGMYEDKFYEFKRTEKNIYHGYRNTDLGKDLEKTIENEFKNMHKTIH